MLKLAISYDFRKKISIVLYRFMEMYVFYLISRANTHYFLYQFHTHRWSFCVEYEKTQLNTKQRI